MNFSPLVRQIIVAIPSELCAIAVGASFGLPGVLMQQMLFNGSLFGNKLDVATLSWIASIGSIAGLGGVIMPSLMQRIGRKPAFILCCVILIAGWLVAFCATKVYMTIIAECLLGLGCNCILTVNYMTIGEMLAPKYRTPLMILLDINQALGIVLVNVIGDFVTWNTLALIMCSLVVVALSMSFIWPESPHWLAYKRKFSECEKAFKTLRGTDDESMSELQSLLTAQKESQLGAMKSHSVKNVWNKFTKRDFNVPMLLMLLIFLNLFMSGGSSLLTYSRYLISLATGDENVANICFYMNDGDLFAGGLIALFLMSQLKTRTIFNLASIRLVFLYSGALVLCLQKYNILIKSPWIFAACFQGYTLVSCSCLNIISFALATDLIPVKHRGIGGALFTIIVCCFMFVTNKLLPYLLIHLDIWGTLLFFALNGTITQVLIWKFLPETKHRTLQEIEEYYNYGSFDKRRNLNHLDSMEPMVAKP